MREIKRTSPIIALIGAMALLSSAPVMAQTPAPAPSAAAAADNTAAAPAESAEQANAETMKVGGSANGRLTPIVMFEQADLVVKIVMIGLLACSVLSWALLVIKLVEFSSLRRTSDRFLETFRGAKSLNEMGRIAESEDFAGNPMADMAAAAAAEVELSRQAGLNVVGEFRDSTLMRASTAIGAVQASLARRLSGGMQFLASVVANAPFIGLFGTVVGILVAFQSMAIMGTGGFSVVAAGISEALISTALGLAVAIVAVIFYNYFSVKVENINAILHINADRLIDAALQGRQAHGH